MPNSIRRKNLMYREGDEDLVQFHYPLIKLCKKFRAICDIESSEANILIRNCSYEFENYLRSNPPVLKYLTPKEFPLQFYRAGTILEIS